MIPLSNNASALRTLSGGLPSDLLPNWYVAAWTLKLGQVFSRQNLWQVAHAVGSPGVFSAPCGFCCHGLFTIRVRALLLMCTAENGSHCVASRTSGLRDC